MHRLIGIAIACGVWLAGFSATAREPEINFLTLGGHYLETYGPLVAKFEKETGIHVNLIVQTAARESLARILAQKDNPQIDVWTSVESIASAAAEAGLLAELKPAQLPNLAELPAEFFKKHYVMTSQSPRGIIYRKDLVPFEIKDWKDLWDPRLKGKIGVSYVIDTASTLVMASLVGGGDEKHIDVGFERMRALKPNIAGIFRSDQEAIKFLESGEFGVLGFAILTNFYLKLSPDSPIRFVMPDTPKFLASIPLAIVKGRGAEREAASHKFVNFMLAAENQEFVTSRFGHFPTNPKAPIPERLKGVISSLPLSNVHTIDWATVNANFSVWGDRWTREIQAR